MESSEVFTVKKLVMGSIAAVATAAFGLVGFALATSSQASAQPFGLPPSGAIPILFNDQHVYAKPDTLQQGRVLAALIRNGVVMVPLRSMFEQMGATVSYDPNSRTVSVTKPGAMVQVTVGQPQVVVNGESRPLDVPPILWHGIVLVPVRVISEGMGAYVQWVPDRHVVVVRYIPAPLATPPPAPPPPPPAPVATMAPPPPPPVHPPPPPTPAPTKPPQSMVFVAGDYMFQPKVYNEFSPGNTGTPSENARAGFAFPLGDLPVMAEGDYRSYFYPHNCSTAVGIVPIVGSNCYVTVIGANGSTAVPSFNARDTDIDGRVGIGIGVPQLYLVGSYLTRWGNYGYPRQTGFGGGLELLPNFHSVLSLYGSAIYYPSVSGNFQPATGPSLNLSYRVLRYQGGLAVSIPSTPIFIEGGVVGDTAQNGTNAPSPFTHQGLYAGVGIHF